MEFTANENKNVSIETSTGTYDRCAIHTHFIEIGEDYNELVERYVKPLCPSASATSSLKRT